MQWISERNAELEEFQDNNGFKTREDFLLFMAQVERGCPRLIASLAAKLTASDEPPGVESLQELARQQAERPFDPDMLLTAACASALAENSDLATWRKIRKIARNSWNIEHWLGEAMFAHAQNEASARKAFADLAVAVFKALESGDLRSESERSNEGRDSAWSHWQTSKFRLDEIWWGLRGSDFMNYEEEMRIFGLLSEIAPAEFQQLIAGSGNPFLVDAALLSAGVGFSPRFAQ